MAETRSLVDDVELDDENMLSQESESELNDCESDTGSFCPKKSGTGTLRNKRMASPLDKPNVKRFTPPPTPKVTRQKPTQKAASKAKDNLFSSDMMLVSFADPSFITKVAPCITSMMQPMIQGAIESAVKTTVDEVNSSDVDKVLQSNKDLQVSNAKLQNMVEKQQGIIDNQAKLLESHKNHIKSAEGKVQDLTKGESFLKSELSNLEQYGRKNSLGLSNMKVKHSDFPTEKEFKQQMVTFINSKVLQLAETETGIWESDLDRCHAVGMRESPQVQVKFQTYETKRRVYSSKKNLKKIPGRVFVTEDLTRYNQNPIKTIIPLKKAEAISSCCTSNGSIFLNKSDSENSVRIQRVEDINRLGLV